MLQTIYSIGREISKGRDEWADIIGPVKVNQKGDSTLYTLTINLDLDDEIVKIERRNLDNYEADFEKLKSWRCFKSGLLQPRDKAIYTSIDSSKIDLLVKSLFGKPNEKSGNLPDKGELFESILEHYPEGESREIATVLKKIVKLRVSFIQAFTDSTAEHVVKKKCDVKYVNDKLELSRNEKIVLVTTCVSWKELSLENYPLGLIDGYEQFIEKRFFGKNISQQNLSNNRSKLCYATGEQGTDIDEANFGGRYNINKFFQNTTLNFASNFDSKNLPINYQVSSEISLFLERGADLLLNKFTCEIADIRHVVIPQFFNQDSFKIKYLSAINKRTELLFKLSELNEVENFLDYYSDVEGLYWLTFIGIDSDGKYFKVGNIVKDVPSFHFRNIQAELKEAGELLSPWLGSKYAFNLYSFYKSIPVRKDKEKVNKALLLFSSILEQRKIEKSQLFKHFSELLLCHWFERYRAYTNISISSKEKFDFTVKDAVFRYLAFFTALQNLDLLKENLFNMETSTTKKNPAESVDSFFIAMGYNDEQKALFYLGRVLNRVVYEQTGVKKHKKNALDKLNYNGMDKQSIYRFANELFEAARHYDISDNIKWDWGRFGEHFDFNNWRMAPQEALFFILTGYTFGIKSEKPKSDDSTNSTNNN